MSGRGVAWLGIMLMLAGCVSPRVAERARLVGAYPERPTIGADYDRCRAESDAEVQGQRNTAGILLGTGVLIFPLLFVGIGLAAGAEDKAGKVYVRCMTALGHPPTTFAAESAAASK